MVGHVVREGQMDSATEISIWRRGNLGGSKVRVALFGRSRAPSPRPRLAQGLAFHPRS